MRKEAAFLVETNKQIFKDRQKLKSQLESVKQKSETVQSEHKKEVWVLNTKLECSEIERSLLIAENNKMRYALKIRPLYQTSSRT